MNKITKLKNEVYRLLAKTADAQGHEEDIAELVNDIDFKALLQNYSDTRRTVYAFESEGDDEGSANYKANPLLYSVSLVYRLEMPFDDGIIISRNRNLEIWVNENFDLIPVIAFEVSVLTGEMRTLTYRTFTSPDADEIRIIEPVDFANELAYDCLPVYERQIPFYEL